MQVDGAVGMAAVAAGAFHNMALNTCGEVYTWGTNDYGQLGNGSTTYNTVPHKVEGLDGIQVGPVVVVVTTHALRRVPCCLCM